MLARGRHYGGEKWHHTGMFLPRARISSPRTPGGLLVTMPLLGAWGEAEAPSGIGANAVVIGIDGAGGRSLSTCCGCTVAAFSGGLDPLPHPHRKTASRPRLHRFVCGDCCGGFAQTSTIQHKQISGLNPQHPYNIKKTPTPRSALITRRSGVRIPPPLPLKPSESKGSGGFVFSPQG